MWVKMCSHHPLITSLLATCTFLSVSEMQRTYATPVHLFPWVSAEQNSKRAYDDLVRCYADHALAASGDQQGQVALARNLKSKDAAIRTYAATFAGDARATGLASVLIAQLDDDQLDARIRAAQTLLDLARRQPPDGDEQISSVVFEATKKNPRYTEGSIIERSRAPTRRPLQVVHLISGGS